MDNTGAAYWKATLGLLTKILVIWFIVSFGAGILFKEALDSISLADTRSGSGLPIKVRSTCSSR